MYATLGICPEQGREPEIIADPEPKSEIIDPEDGNFIPGAVMPFLPPRCEGMALCIPGDHLPPAINNNGGIPGKRLMLPFKQA